MSASSAEPPPRSGDDRLLAELARAYVQVEFFGPAHPTPARLLGEVASGLRARGAALEFGVGEDALRLPESEREHRYPHAARFAARLREHGAGEMAVPPTAPELLGRSLAAAALEPRVARAAGGLAGTLRAVGAAGFRVNGVQIPPTEGPSGAAPGEIPPPGAPILDEAARAEPLAALARLRAEAEACGVADAGRRAALLDTMQRLAPPRVVERLAGEMAAAKAEEERAGLRRTLVHLGARAVPPLLAALAGATEVSARRALRDALVALDAVGVPLPADTVEDERWWVVRNLVSILGETRAADAAECFARTLTHPDPRVRRETVHALGKLGGEEGALLLARALHDADADVRGAAAVGLGLVPTPASTAALLEGLERERATEVRTEMVRALGRLADPVALEPLTELAAPGGWLSRRTVPERLEAVHALAALGDAGRAALLALRGDGAPEVAAAVRAALEAG